MKTVIAVALLSCLAAVSAQHMPADILGLNQDFEVVNTEAEVQQQLSTQLN